MRFNGALIEEQGLTFAIIIVNDTVLNSDYAAKEMILFGKREFGDIPIVLMSHDNNGIPTYRGREDIVNFLTEFDHSHIHWEKYNV